MSGFAGRFIITDKQGKEIILPNMIVDEGITSFLKMMMQASTADIIVGGNFYVGICGNTTPETDWVLTDIAGEPSAAGGYARQAVARSAVGWPTIGAVNTLIRAQSVDITFAASGAAYDASLYRLFLCNVASGTAGKLYAVSKALTTAITIGDGQSYTVKYELYFKGA
jgi:hypothetical protein